MTYELNDLANATDRLHVSEAAWRKAVAAALAAGNTEREVARVAQTTVHQVRLAKAVHGSATKGRR